MTRPTDIRLGSVQAEVTEIAYRTPMKFGGRVVRSATILDIDVEVETRDGRRGAGHGSMPLGNVWAWPASDVSSDDTLRAMRRLSELLVDEAREYRQFGHPLEITLALATGHRQAAQTACAQSGVSERMPRLAEMVVASPIEAAIHDAYGKTLGFSSYDLLGPEFTSLDLGSLLLPELEGQYLDRYTLREPKWRMPLYHLVGALDPLTLADVKEPVGDGLPETLGEWIQHDGLTHLKIKLNGDNLEWDVARVAAVEHAACEVQAARGCRDWNYSLDFNERCANVDYVLDFLAQLRELTPHGFDRVQYIEQPTHRDLRANPENRMHAAARIKPVVIDESLVDLDSLLMCRELGYSGVALKACKGHTEALLMAAAAQHFGMFLCVQDLTCPGASFLHSASLSARIPNVAAIEGNARQYCPRGNHGWADRFPGMFHISDGTVATAELAGPGLGF